MVELSHKPLKRAKNCKNGTLVIFLGDHKLFDQLLPYVRRSLQIYMDADAYGGIIAHLH